MLSPHHLFTFTTLNCFFNVGTACITYQPLIPFFLFFLFMIKIQIIKDIIVVYYKRNQLASFKK